MCRDSVTGEKRRHTSWIAQGSLARADSQSSLAASPGLPSVIRASLKASSKSVRRLDLPAGLPDCPGFHFAAGLPETPDLNLVFRVIVLIPKETNTTGRAGTALGVPSLRRGSVRNVSSLGSQCDSPLRFRTEGIETKAVARFGSSGAFDLTCEESSKGVQGGPPL
jgi:hypothetical protein